MTPSRDEAIGHRARPAGGSARGLGRSPPAMTAPGHAASAGGAGSLAWRPILRRRLVVIAGAVALWVAGIEGRLVYLQVFENADLLARAERQHERTQSAPAKRGDILDRRGRVLATSVDADTIYAVPSEIQRRAGRRPASSATRCGDCTAKDRQGLVERLGTRRAFAYVRRQVAPDQARRVAALNLDGIGFTKESKRFYPEQGAGRAPARMGRHRQQGAGRPRIRLRPADSREGRHDPDPDGCAPPCVQPGRASADGRFERRADDRPVPAAHRRARAARGRGRKPRRRRQRHRHESAHRRDSRDGERADVQPERVPRRRRRRAPESRRAGSVRAGLDLQGRHRLGGDGGKGLSGGRAHQRERAGGFRSARASCTTPTTTACCRSRTSSSSRATSARSRSG